MGTFADWQPQYAAHGIVTFPVTIDDAGKRPAVKGYLKLGAATSDQLALKFADHDGIGLACARNKITVLDIDTTDERVLADGLSRHGRTPFIVRSGSGHFQAWYRHNGERRRIRPDPRVPVDILGDGFVVAPPSRGARGRYEIIQGTLDDLDNLPRLVEIGSSGKDAAGLGTLAQPVATSSPAPTDRWMLSTGKFEKGSRNDNLWRHCMRIIRGCVSFDDLMRKTMAFNQEAIYEPLPDAEVLKIIASAMSYEAQGKNWFGHGARVAVSHDLVDDLAAREPRAFALLSLLMRHHWGREFAIAKTYAKSLGWAVNTLRDAKNVLVDDRLIICVHQGGKGPNDPPRYVFGEGVKN